MSKQLRRAWAELGALTPLQFARECLGFEPDEPQAGILERALHFHKIWAELQPAVGKVHGRRSAGGVPVDYGGGGDGVGGWSVTEAGGGDGDQGQEVFAGVWIDEEAAGGWGKLCLGGAAERFADCGTAGKGSDDSRVFGGVDVDH